MAPVGALPKADRGCPMLPGGAGCRTGGPKAVCVGRRPPEKTVGTPTWSMVVAAGASFTTGAGSPFATTGDRGETSTAVSSAPRLAALEEVRSEAPNAGTPCTNLDTPEGDEQSTCGIEQSTCGTAAPLSLRERNSLTKGFGAAKGSPITAGRSRNKSASLAAESLTLSAAPGLPKLAGASASKAI